MLDRLLEWDRDTFLYLNSLGIEEYDQFWSAVTHTTTWIPLFVLFFIVVFVAYPKKEALSMVLTILVLLGSVMALMESTKALVERLRPNNDEKISALIRILITPDDYSFFSGHAANSFAITTLLVLFLWKRWHWVWIFYFWPLLFSLSRIYVGVHYPLDLIAGSLVGIAMAVIFYRLYQRFITPCLA